MFSISNPHSGHRERLKKEFKENGLLHFPEHKALELLLFYSIPRADTNEIGHRLIERFGSISGVFDADISMLKETKGLGEESAVLIKLVTELIVIYMEDYYSIHNTILNIEDAKNYMSYKFTGKTAECLYVACLAANGKVIFCDIVSEGAPESVNIRPLDIVRIAIKNNAVKVVLAHNHPRGIANPSNADLSSTVTIRNELNRVDIELFDHIIVAHDAIYSMREKGMIPMSRSGGFP